MQQLVKFFSIVLASILLVACGPKVDLDYKRLESQYVELTPYWEMIFKNQTKTNSIAAIEFSNNYRAARELINYYNTASRDINTDGSKNADAPSDIDILWNLRLKLNYASKYTNEISNIIP